MKNHQCNLCGQKFARKEQLKYHDEGVHQRLRFFKCDWESGCSQPAFYKIFDLHRHIRTVHEKIRNHMCYQCGKGFTNQKTLTKHISVIHQKTERTEFEVCQVCDLNFASIHTLNRHIYMEHDLARKFSCDKCDRVDHCLDSYVRHEKRAHTDVNYIKKEAPETVPSSGM